MPFKTHQTAVVALPPPHVWGPIQAIRRHYDRQFEWWMPHINLLYPFVPPEQFDEAADRLTEACREIAPFGVILGQFRFFTHRSGRSTIWLEPEPHKSFLALHERLLAAFPDCDDLNRYPGGFMPHLSVGQTDTPETLRNLLDRLQADWDPLPFDLNGIALIRRDDHDPFRVVREFTLRGASLVPQATA